MIKEETSESFYMKDMKVAKQILGIRIIHESKEKKFWLSQEHYIKRVFQKFHMEKAKVMSTILLPLILN